MNVLVTGAGGFVGSHLCAALRSEHRVVALLRRHQQGVWDQVVEADIAQPMADEGFVGVDVVVHLAALTHAVHGADESSYRRVNVEGTRHVLRAAALAGVRRFVFVSSVKAIGETGGDGSTPQPSTPYGRTKLEAERLVVDQHEIPETIVLRPAMIYGETKDGNLARLIRLLERAPWIVPRSDARRSMVGLATVVSALALAATSDTLVGRNLVVTDGRDYSLDEISDWVLAALNRSSSGRVPLSLLRTVARMGDLAQKMGVQHVPLDSESLNKLTGEACYDGSALHQLREFQIISDLEQDMPAVVRAALQG